MKYGALLLLALLAFSSPADAQGWFRRRTPTPVPTPLFVATPPPKPTPVPTPKLPPRQLVALPVYDETTSVRLQIFLDNNEFGPGKIDGRIGEFFRKALLHYKRAHGMSETGAVDQWLLEQGQETYTTVPMPAEADNYLGTTASKPQRTARSEG